MKRELILIVDTETNCDGLVFDIGGIVADLYGNIKYEFSYLIDEEFQKKLFFETLKPKYLQYLYYNKTQLLPQNIVIARLKTILDRFNIKRVFAYNSNFDENVIKKTFKDNNPFKTLEFECIWLHAVQTICLKRYKKWAIKHNKLTEKGYISTNAENVYQFIKKDNDFQEEHTALSDAKIEYKILLKCRNNHITGRKKGSMADTWLLAQPYEIIKDKSDFIKTKWENLQG